MNLTPLNLRRIVAGTLAVAAFFGGAVVAVMASNAEIILSPYVTQSGTSPVVWTFTSLAVGLTGICVMVMGLKFAHIAIEGRRNGDAA